MTKIKITLLLVTFWSLCYGQNYIDVTEQTLKIKGMSEEEMYFGFAAGDKLIFNFKEVNGKDVKEIEIIEYPNTSKFADFKRDKITDKVININKQSVYKFRFLNNAIAGRVCRIKIQRIPASSETINFNSNVDWVIKQDTTWNTYTRDVIIGYDTTYHQGTRRELIKSEQREEIVSDKSQRVHSVNNSNGNKTSIFFTLPANKYSINETEEVVAWAYWVGVGDEANKAWEQNTKTLGTLAKGVASYYVTPLGALAIGSIANLIVPSVGEDVYYAITDENNRGLFHAGQPYRLFDEGKGIAGFKKFTDKGMCQGTYFVCLLNDNQIVGINATVKVIAIIEKKVYENKEYTEQRITPRTEKQIVKEPVIKTNKVPVTGD